MRTGTKFSEEYTDLKAEIRQYEQVIGWRPQTDPQPADDLWGYICTLSNARPHGAPFEYARSSPICWAGYWNVPAGRRYAELLSRELWARLGAEHDAEIAVDPHGHPVADGGISVTLRDSAASARPICRAATSMDLRSCRQTGCATAGRATARRARLRWLAAGDPLPGRHVRNQWWVKDPVHGVFLGSASTVSRCSSICPPRQSS